MSKKTIENIKMIIIVVLFLATILLLYLIWGGSENVKVSDLIPGFSKQSAEIELGGTVEPEKTYYSLGDGSYRNVTDSYYSYCELMSNFRQLSDNSTVMPTEITEEQYEEAIKNHPSIISRFNYELPFAELCKNLGISGSSAYESIGNITDICLSSIVTDSILVANRFTNKYYRLVSDKVSLEFKEPANYKPDYLCYEVSRVLGAGENGLFPLLTTTMMSPGTYKEESLIDSEQISEIAKTVFGDSFDFVRRISDGFGNYTFMYGYGQKTLTLGQNGSVEYKTEVNSGSSKGFFEDLKTAKSFYSELLSYISINDTDATLKLKDVKVSGSGKNAIYTYCFNMHFPPYDICEENTYALEVKVEKGQVSWLRCKIVPADFEYDPSLPHNVMDAANVIAANSVSSDTFTRIAENYKSMEESYFMKEGNLIPAWRLILQDGSTIFYDIYTGEVLK